MRSKFLLGTTIFRPFVIGDHRRMGVEFGEFISRCLMRVWLATTVVMDDSSTSAEMDGAAWMTSTASMKEQGTWDLMRRTRKPFFPAGTAAIPVTDLHALVTTSACSAAPSYDLPAKTCSSAAPSISECGSAPDSPRNRSRWPFRKSDSVRLSP